MHFYFKNLKFKHLIDNIVIDFLFFTNNASINDKRCKSMMDLSKFTSIKNIELNFVKNLL